MDFGDNPSNKYSSKYGILRPLLFPFFKGFKEAHRGSLRRLRVSRLLMMEQVHKNQISSFGSLYSQIE